MPTPLEDFMTVVTNFMAKDIGLWTEGGTPDKMLFAINNARRRIEREVNFEYAKTVVKLVVDPVLGGDLSAAVDFIDGTTVVPVKKVIRAFRLVSDGSDYYYPLNIVSDKGEDNDYRRQLDLRMMGTTHGPTYNPHGHVSQDVFVEQQGTLLFATPRQPSPTTLKIKVYKWLTPYRLPAGEDDGFTDDWMLQYCRDYLLYKTIDELNIFEREDQRVPISNAKMNDARISVIAWDSDLLSDDQSLN